MKIHDLYQKLFESVEADMPETFSHTMPHTMSFPSMDPYYEYYRFVIAMAGHPESNSIPLESPLRNIPLAVAYTPEEFDMIKAVCKRMGKKPSELAYKKSQEPTTVNKVSPVAKRGKFE